MFEIGFRFLEVGKKTFDTHAIVFFFSRTFNENFNFLKTYKIQFSHYTPKGAPVCELASKLYGWDLRNIAKFAQKGPKTGNFWTFSISSKTVHTI